MRAIDADKLEVDFRKLMDNVAARAPQAISTREALNMALQLVQWAGTIDPAKNGRWNTMNFGGERYFKCSHCGVGYVRTMYDYCPYCGSKMGIREYED